MMLIGILQCGHFPPADGFPDITYSDLYARMLRGHGFSHKTWSVVDMAFPESVHEAQGWLITGSKYGAYDDEPFISPLEDFICQAYAKSIPLVGVCFGHQIIAQALGGRVEKFSGGWAVGQTDYDFDGQSMSLNAWHQDQVVEKPARAKNVASNDFCEHAALLYTGKAYTVQPHPEFDANDVDRLTNIRRGFVPDDLLDTAVARMGKDLDNQALADRIATFFKTGSPA